MRPITWLLLCTAFLFPDSVLAQDSSKPIQVRVGEHAEFSRIVFDWPAKGPYRVEQSGGRATVHFEQSGTLELSRYKRNPPPMVQGISPRPEDGGLAVEIDIPPGAKLRHFFHGTHVVVDVMKPAAGVQRAAKPQPAAATAPVAAAAAAQAKPKATASAIQLATRPSGASSGQGAEQSDYMSRIVANGGGGERTMTAESVSNSYDWPFDPHFTIGGNVSTLGLGAEAGIRLNDFFGIRIGANYLKFGFSPEYEDVEYDADFNLLSGGGVLDIYPFGGGFRVTGGLRYNANKIDLEASPTTSITIGGQTFTAAEAGRLEGDADFNNIAPYAGFGFEGILLNGYLSLGFDLGVLYQGKPDIDLDGNGTLASDPTFLAALNDEADDIEDDLSFLGFYPVVGLSANLRF